MAQGHVYGKLVAELNAAELIEFVEAKLESYAKRGRLLELQEQYVRKATVKKK